MMKQNGCVTIKSDALQTFNVSLMLRLTPISLTKADNPTVLFLTQL